MKYMRLNKDEQRDFLAELASMADYLETSFAGLTPLERVSSGPDDSFSPIEHVWHLADLEQQGFAERIRRLLQEVCPELANFAGARIAREGNYKQRSWSEGIAEFRHRRTANLEQLRGLDKEQWLRRGNQQGVGPVAMCDMPSLMAEHDAAHRAEIAGWLGWHGRSAQTPDAE
jgi:hypothetical protein